MIKIPLSTYENNSSAAKYIKENSINLCRGAKIISCAVAGNNVVGDYSCFNRCEVGKYSGMGCFSYVADSLVGRYCTIASRVSIGAFSHPLDWLSVHEFQYRDTSEIYGETLLEGGENVLRRDELETALGHDVWIGDNVCIRRGVKIGHGAVVGLGSVVTKNVEPYSIVVGNPAKPVKSRFTDEQISDLLDLEWWSLDLSELRDVNFNSITDAISLLKLKLKERKEVVEE